MATESDLRDLLQGPDPEGRAAIDLDAVLTRARRRRRPRVILTQALGSVAAVGVLLTGVVVTLPHAAPASLMVAEDSAGGGEELASGPEAADESSLRVPAETCAAPYAPAPAAAGWALEIAPATADAGSATLDVPVTLVNTATTAVSAVVSAPRIVLTRDGVVVGHAPAVDAPGVVVELAPGEGVRFAAPVEPTACDPSAPDATADRLELLGPGEYEMRPSIVISSGVGEPVTVTGAAQTLTIR